ncbi:FecR domain-containing protein [Marinilongibacter aquaticus]|uniref:FecR family protein n=1 Tax=Marinilongibacter aquaticus TaxID=2975157 RepID=UPI0021BD7940|nr:FecR domain-containing protein [Marinilongibacter aquaticus]UBM60291.1 FecR domain-containing protein [Marinilongibacter aquaticus]
MKEEISEEILARYFAEEASIEELQKLNAWLESDVDHARVLRQYQQIWEANEKNKSFQPDIEKAWRKVEKRIDEKKKPNWISWAAVVAGILLISTYYFANKEPELSYSSIKTERAQTEKTLADGSKITLNSFSLLEFPESFSDDERRVKLIGEAFFDIAKNPDKPFIIEANGTEIKVLGTAFSILARDENVQVSVQSGTVEFKSVSKEKVVLHKGDEAKYESAKANIQVSHIEDPNIFAYKTKVFEFNQAPIEKVVQTLNKAYQTYIQLEGDSWNDYQLTTKFEHEDLDQVLDIVATTLNLELKKEEKSFVLTKKTEEP